MLKDKLIYYPRRSQIKIGAVDSANQRCANQSAKELIKNRLAIERNNYAKGGWFVSIDLDVKYVETFEEAVALATAAMGVDLKACRDELCLHCGRYVNAHEGGCDGCRWKDL